MINTPLEHYEQVALVHWLTINNYIFSKIPNETYTKSWSQKRKNTTEWLKAWLPDLLILMKRWSLLFLELKRAKKSLSKVSKEQQEWINNLNTINNVEAIICYWWEEAISQIKILENK